MQKYIKALKKFTVLDEVFAKLGKPKFKLDNRLVYYMGNGVLICYCDKRYKIENNQRIEYGEAGQFLETLYYFSYVDELMKVFKLNPQEYRSMFDYENTSFFDEVLIDIHIGDTYKKTSQALSKRESDFYNEGVTNSFDKEKSLFLFQNKWITYNEYEFLFFGKSINAKLSAFIYNFPEDL